MNFNTSHVSINHGLQYTVWPAMGISIHLMFLLIELAQTGVTLKSHFNTSHVSINQRGGCWMRSGKMNFNTSHVSINQFCLF